MKKIFLITLMSLASLISRAQVYMHFQEPSLLPDSLKETITSEFNLNCIDAFTYRWSIAESSTRVRSEEPSTPEKKKVFSSRFMSITATMFEFNIVSEAAYDAEEDLWVYKVVSFEGTCN